MIACVMPNLLRRGLTVLGFVLYFTVSVMAAESPPKHVAIILDDGPVPAQAAAFRELFAKEDVKVTWAYVAREVAAHPELARAAVAAGHEVANHSFAHLHPKSLSDEELHHEIVVAQEVYAAQLGEAKPVWYWRPFTEADPRQPKYWQEAGVKDFGFTHQVWSHDWNPAVTAEQIYTNAVTGVEDGSLIIFHEWRPETLAQMPAILAELKRQGCVFVTVSELAMYLESK